jgi:hypothetical protein
MSYGNDIRLTNPGVFDLLVILVIPYSLAKLVVELVGGSTFRLF